MHFDRTWPASKATITAPLRWRKPARVMVSDLFAEGVPDEWIDRVFAVMALSPQHTFQVLTKRAARLRDYLTRQRDVLLGPAAEIVAEARRIRPSDLYCMTKWPLPNVWLGVSAERQQEADERIPEFLATPAAVRFVSAEPLLGTIDFTAIKVHVPGEPEDWFHRVDALTGRVWDDDGTVDGAYAEGAAPRLDWIIVGGESGPNARPMHPDWARAIRDQCAAAGVAFFFKQWGAWAPGECAQHAQTTTERVATLLSDPGEDVRWSFGTVSARAGEEMHRDDEPDVWHFGKSHAGRLLDGIEHNAFPEV